MKKRVFEKEVLGARDRIEVIQYGTSSKGTQVKNPALQYEIPLEETGCTTVSDYVAQLYQQGYREKMTVGSV